MRGVKGTRKEIGDPCARCEKPITEETAIPNPPEKGGLMSYCRPCWNEMSRNYGKQNREKRLKRNREYRAEIRDKVFAAYGRKCACCGETRWQFLAIDHVNGGGSAHRRQQGLSTPTQLRKLIIKQGFPKTYQLLCHNCNMAKGFYGRCPHEDERDAKSSRTQSV